MVTYVADLLIVYRPAAYFTALGLAFAWFLPKIWTDPDSVLVDEEIEKSLSH
jgi:hypothetical protein